MSVKKLADLIDLNPSNEEESAVTFEPLNVTETLAMIELEKSFEEDVEEYAELKEALESSESVLASTIILADEVASMEEFSADKFKELEKMYLDASSTIGVPVTVASVEAEEGEENPSLEAAADYAAKVKEWAKKVLEMIKKTAATLALKAKQLYTKAVVVLANDGSKTKALADELKAKIDSGEIVAPGAGSNIFKHIRESYKIGHVYDSVMAFSFFGMGYEDAISTDSMLSIGLGNDFKGMESITITPTNAKALDGAMIKKLTDNTVPKVEPKEGDEVYVTGFNGSKNSVIILSKKDGKTTDISYTKVTIQGFDVVEKLLKDLMEGKLENEVTKAFNELGSYTIKNLSTIAGKVAASSKSIKEVYGNYEKSIAAINAKLKEVETEAGKTEDAAQKAVLDSKVKALQKLAPIQTNLLLDQTLGIIAMNKAIQSFLSYKNYQVKDKETKTEDKKEGKEE